ncbi:MAG: hypothetical protein JXB49_11830 [Bacteroidales bacterium]|nr:hypothetical protein [Bacteroidales bacterium]
MKNTKLFLMFLIALFISASCGQKDYDRINEVGIVGAGIINKVEDTNVTVNDNPRVRMYVTIYSLNKEPFDAQVTTVVSRVAIPRSGDWLALKFDPEDNQKVIWLKDEDIDSDIQMEIENIRAKNQQSEE